MEPTNRYKFCTVFSETLDDGTDIIYLGDREPIKFIDDAENEVYVVVAGDSLQSIASKKFDGFPEPSNMWWVLAEFQPTPIFDPTLRLEPGAILIIPSVSLVHNLINTNYADKII